MIKKFTYQPSDTPGNYHVCFGDKPSELSAYLKPYIKHYENVLYVIDQNLPETILDTVVTIAKINPTNVIKINTRKKSVEQLITIWDRMVETVPSAVIAIGGGTIGDLSGLACGTYQRGVPRIYFPTTVLSMVDASIGGKSGIDHTNVKNSIGVLHYPDVVINYTPFLSSLDKSEYWSGFAEVIKAAVLYDRVFFEELEKVSTAQRLSEETATEILYKSARIKAQICEEKDNKKIRLLYGHAIGHAYEKMTNNHRKHGDCVAIGMHTEGAIAVLSGYWKRNEWTRQAKLLQKFNLPLNLPSDTDIDLLIVKMDKYKKLTENGKLLFVLPKAIGKIVNQDNDCRVRFETDKVIVLIDQVLSGKLNS